ncbi:copper resistance CopC/CopD family protein [Microvirga sp. M2]|uniref:copper resistance CopC/CopD family protein n=1 Tax=Microvirga sp. M2 TaxID=3073270 RepID=UPI0039C16983
MIWLRPLLFCTLEIVCTLLLVCGLLGGLLGGRAEAHASLIEAIPADGAVLTAAPSRVQLRFNEPVAPLRVQLTDAKGIAHGDLKTEARDSTVTLSLPGNLPQGTQVVSYRVISSDGHPVAGSIVFSIGAPTSASRPAGLDEPVAAAIWLARLSLYIGLFAGAGGGVFALWIAPGATPQAALRIMRAAMGLGLGATIVSVGLQGLDVLGASFPLLLSPHPWHAGISTSFGPTAMTGVGALLCAWLALSGVAGRASRGLALLGLGGAGLALALSGHASAAEPQWLTRPAVFLHGVAAAFWVGSLAPLALVVGRMRKASSPIVRRFSTVAVPMVGLLVLTGLTLSVIQVATPAALLSTAYGRVLLAKLTAVIILLALAALNRQRLTPALARVPAASRALVRSIMREVALAMVILGLVATWRFTPPPRVLLETATEPVSTHIHTAQAMVELTLSPSRAGPVQASMTLTTGDFAPLDPKEVTLTLARPAAGIEPITRAARRDGDGSWHVDNLIIPQPGRWQIRVDALVTDFDKAALEGEVEIKP